METTQENKTTMKFNNSIEALNYLVNDAWDRLTLEQRKFLRQTKNNLNHHKSISLEKAEAVLLKFGKVQKIIEINV